jgi:hypothetical protein
VRKQSSEKLCTAPFPATFTATRRSPRNRGIVDLHLTHAFGMSDETSYAVYDSLKTLPTLQVLSLTSTLGF